MTRSLNLSAFLLLVVVIGAIGASRGEPARWNQPAFEVSHGPSVPALRGASHDVPVPSLSPEAAQPSAGAPVSVPVSSGEVGTAIMAGNISWADPELGGDYLATRFPRGTLVKICAVHCLVRRTNDFGPHAGIRPNRIADLAVLDWEQICRLPRDRGLCPGTVEAIEDFELPRTDMEGD